MRARGGAILRGAGTLALLAIALGASALLAWQAHDAAASHRAATEAVLRDYAGLAAAELLRRSASEIGYRGHYAVVQALAAGGDRSALARDADAPTRRALALVRRTFTIDLTSRAVALEGADDPTVVAWLAENAAPPGGREPFACLQGIVDGHLRLFALAPPRTGRARGYEVEPAALAPFVQSAIDEGPLLPSSLGHGRVGNDHLAVVLRDPKGGEVFRRGAGWSGTLRVSAPGGDAYAGVLRGFSAEAEIDPSAAADLVIGGLPGSRLPQVLALLGLAAGLLAATLVQLRRERALQRLRAEFVASASHELRTPLAQVRMFAETLRLGRVRSEEERQRSLQILDREARRLGHLVENLLQFSQAGRGPSTPIPEAQELATLTAEVVESFRPVADGAGARVTAAVAPGLRARVDADAWRQIVLNLLDNAVKYGPRGQEVAVSLEAAGRRLRLVVEDEGPGIPPAERERVFERFQRLERDRASTVTGTGLGLAVVRELVERGGGRCAVESGKRGGARVVVDLPAAQEVLP